MQRRFVVSEMVLFKVEGYGDGELTPALYIIQIIWCILVPIPLIFIIRCWFRFEWTRNTRTLFTLYMSAIDSASRIIFFFYFLFRLIMIYTKGLWLDDDRGLLKLPCNATPFVPINGSLVPSNYVDPCEGENMISRQHCLTFSLFMFWGSTWPMTSLFLLQIHALVGSIIPTKYETFVTIKFAFFTMCIPFTIDLIMGILAYFELQIGYIQQSEPEIMDGCKFEYFSRLSVINSSYVFVLLVFVGVMSLVQLMFCGINHHKQKKFVNAAANSPFHGWSKMPMRERVLTCTIMVLAVIAFICFIIHFIVYLVQGNSMLRQILNITISVFSFIGPIELMWFNIDIRRAVFILVFGEEEKKEKSCDSTEKMDTSLSSEESTEELTQNMNRDGGIA